MGSPDEAQRRSLQGLEIEHSTVDRLVEQLVDAAESLSAGFDQWQEQYVSGPSLYGVVFASANYEQYVDPLGANTWPTDIARTVSADQEAFVTAAQQVAFSQDGAFVVTVDGTIQEQMVRIRSPTATDAEDREAVDYADWMGTKHLSAVEVSTRDEVLAAVTLSEETGRVSVFRDGSYEDRKRHELGGRWREAR